MKAIITTIILIGLVLLLAVTNPSPEQHSNYLRQEMSEQAKHEGEMTQAIVLLFGGMAEEVLANATTRENYLLFSVYSTGMADNDLMVLGIIGNFFVLSDNS